MKELTFITACHGTNYIKFLVVFLESIHRLGYENAIILWQNIDTCAIEALKQKYSKYTFIETFYDLSSDITIKISSKMLFWAQGTDIAKTKYLCLIDSDMLVYKKINQFLTHMENKNIDIIFTYKYEPYELNSGIILCKNSENLKMFINKWKKITQESFTNKYVLSQAVLAPYGGVDQYALYKYLNYRKEKRKYIIEDLVFEKCNCKLLNETNSSINLKHTHIIHYKGSWHNVIINRGTFTFLRAPVNAKEHMKMFFDTYDFIAKSLPQLDMRKPFYLNKRNQINLIIYYPFCVFEYFYMRYLSPIKNKFFRKINW